MGPERNSEPELVGILVGTVTMSDRRNCTECRYCGMDMDMDPYCAHPEVLKTNRWGSSVNVVRGAPLRGDDERRRLSYYGRCGQEAKLFEPRRS